MIDYFIIATALFLSGLFSSMETAILSADKLAIKIREENSWRARIAMYLLNHSSFFITTILIGNTISLVIYGIFMTKHFDPLISDILTHYLGIESRSNVHMVLNLLTSTTISTSIVLLMAEFNS